MPRPPDRTRRRRGRLCRALLASAALAAGGCEGWRTVKVDNPVLGPPPPRLSWDEQPDPGAAVADASGESTAGYVKVSLTESGPISDYAVVATVNGEPILAGEVLAPFNAHFVKAAAQGVPEREIERVKTALIRQHLPQRIETVLLVQSLRLMLKPEQLKQMDEQLDKEFAKENRRIMEKFGVHSKVELERALAQEGSSLAEYEQAFKNQQLAMLYLGTKTGERTPVIGRQEIVEYYTANVAKYEHTARARFQLLMATFAGNGGKEQARAKIDAALAELDRGEAFGDVVMRHSDGPQAKKGGQHDWFKPGEFNSPEVDRALFELPVGQVSPVYEMPNAFVVVKVTEREPAGRTPLSEVQDEIRSTLLKQARETTVRDLLAELRENAVVTTYLE
ncbi:MAG TPA: peptidyl-prolyl cis-trans isomerase [Planctomycetaceae bacterium]